MRHKCFKLRITLAFSPPLRSFWKAFIKQHDTYRYHYNLFTMSTPVAWLVEHATHLQRPCPHRSSPGLLSDLWPFATCHPPLSHHISCHLSSCPVKKTHTQTHTKFNHLLNWVVVIQYTVFLLFGSTGSKMLINQTPTYIKI